MVPRLELSACYHRLKLDVALRPSLHIVAPRFLRPSTGDMRGYLLVVDSASAGTPGVADSEGVRDAWADQLRYLLPVEGASCYRSNNDGIRWQMGLRRRWGAWVWVVSTTLSGECRCRVYSRAAVQPCVGVRKTVGWPWMLMLMWLRLQIKRVGCVEAGVTMSLHGAVLSPATLA